MDCKGVAAWVFGGVLQCLLKDPALGANQAQRLARVNEMREQWYSQHPGVIKLPTILLANCS
eukprot:3504325-Lingulodinium_polyedra.AAC.1